MAPSHYQQEVQDCLGVLEKGNKVLTKAVSVGSAATLRQVPPLPAWHNLLPHAEGLCIGRAVYLAHRHIGL